MPGFDELISAEESPLAVLTPEKTLYKPHGIAPHNGTATTHHRNTRDLTPVSNMHWFPFYTDEEQRELININFEFFDLNRDGKLDITEFRFALRALGFPLPNPDTRRLLTEKGDGTFITQAQYEEVAFELIRTRSPEQELRCAFNTFDRAGRGLILFEDIKQRCQDVGEHIPDEELEVIIHEFDRDGKGSLNFKEFCRMLSNRPC